MEGIDREDYEVVVGLEVHIQLNTKSKAFNSDLNKFGCEPNTNAGAITLAHPGTLPKVNKAQLEKAMILAFATKSEINMRNQFDRKNYFYPDLTKGYQITQDRHPISVGGSITFECNGELKKIRLHHTHMEEDAGKSSHELSSKFSMVDYNRAGTPLLEMVTEPDLRSSDEVHDFMAAVQRLVRYLGISDGNMEEGSMRCDCNVSVRKKGSKIYGERCEIKNVNSKKFAKQAVDYEFQRQLDLVEKGISFSKQTLNFNPETGVTTPLRNKEDAHDYRYFPDPDLPPIQLTEEYVESIRRQMPLLPEEYEDLLLTNYKLTKYDASLLTQDKSYVDYFILLAEHYKGYKNISKLLINKLIPYANEQKLNVDATLITQSRVYEFLKLIDDNKVSPSAAYQRLFPEMMHQSNEDLNDLAKKLNILKSEDQSFVLDIVNDLLAKHPNELAKYKKGNKALLGFFMGQAMKGSGGKADPKVLKLTLIQKLDE